MASRLLQDWRLAHPNQDKSATNVEFVLQRIDETIDYLKSLCPFPVGAIYASVSGANPSTLWVGTTWDAWGSGRVPVGVSTNDTDFNTVEKTGGAKTHTLTIAQMPSHDHAPPPGGHWSTGWHNGRRVGETTASYDGGVGNVLPTGGGEAHNNLQPYITCYMWRRLG
jgi:hypothetical protein